MKDANDEYQKFIDKNGDIKLPLMSTEELACSLNMPVDELKEFIVSTPSRHDAIMNRLLHSEEVLKTLRDFPGTSFVDKDD